MYAIYFIVNEEMADMASATALQMSLHWDCDFHIFIERRDPSAPIREVGEGRITYHYEELGALLPDDLPEIGRWPRIIHLRFFAPRVLSGYHRVLYLDADILAFGADTSLWQVPLPHGLGAVDDLPMLFQGRHQMARGDWLAQIGVYSGKYANSGVLLIDPEIFNKTDFAVLLPKYFADFPKASLPDQDFLAHTFDGRWTVLSPRFNWQAGVLDWGLTRAVAPIFVHFCMAIRPWHGHPPDWHSPNNPEYVNLYEQVLHYAMFEPEQYYKNFSLPALRRTKYALLRWGDGYGLPSRRKTKRRAEWMQNHTHLRDYINAQLAEGGFAADERTRLELSEPQIFWDGRFIRIADDLPPGDPLIPVSSDLTAGPDYELADVS